MFDQQKIELLQVEHYDLHMKQTDITSKIRDLLIEQGDFLGMDAELALAKDVFFDSSTGGPEGLDSLAAISIAVELEESFGTTFQSEKFVGINKPTVLIAIVVQSMRMQGLVSQED